MINEFKQKRNFCYIKKDGKLIEMESDHIFYICNHYKDFGLSENEINNWCKKWNINLNIFLQGPTGEYDDKENELMNMILKKGNCRINYGKHNNHLDMYVFHHWNNKKKYIRFFTFI